MWLPLPEISSVLSVFLGFVQNIKRNNILVPFKTNYFSHFLFNPQSNYHLWKVFWYDRVISFPKQISFNNTETFQKCSNTIELEFHSISVTESITEFPNICQKSKNECCARGRPQNITTRLLFTCLSTCHLLTLLAHC